MHTGRSLTICWSLPWGAGGVWSWRVCSQIGCLLPGGCGPRGVGVSALGGGVCSCQGVSALGGYIPACTEADTPPPVDRQKLVKILPWPNFVVAGKHTEYRYVTAVKYRRIWQNHPCMNSITASRKRRKHSSVMVTDKQSGFNTWSSLWIICNLIR